LTVLSIFFIAIPPANALPSFARQTHQQCAACHVGGDWPQLTPWGRFFKLSGYTAGSSVIEREGADHLPLGVLGQAGLTWAAQPNNTMGQSVIAQNGSPELYQFTAEVATKVTNVMGVFYEYQMSHTFPGWKGVTGDVDVRAVHFFHVAGHEVLAGIDSNNSPTAQDVWNSVPSWNFPFYSSPQAPGAPASPMITSLGSQVGSIGAYALVDRTVYVETSFYRAGTGFLRWMSAGVSFQNGGANYLDGYNPYWRAYWTHSRGPHSLMIGTFGIRASVFPDSAMPTGRSDLFTDYGFDSQYQYLGEMHKITLRGSYIYERRSFDGSFPLGLAGETKGNLKTLNLNGSYVYGNAWAVHAGYFLTNGNNDSTLYGVDALSGDQVSASPLTTGYNLEVDRHLTQDIQLIAQYRGFFQVNGRRHNIDGIGRSASDDNTLWLSVFFGF
jgi:hypothetical protein